MGETLKKGGVIAHWKSPLKSRFLCPPLGKQQKKSSLNSLAISRRIFVSKIIFMENGNFF